MNRRWVAGVALVAAAGLAGAGCGSEEEEGPEVAWADDVCAEANEKGSKLTLPDSEPKSPKETKKQMITFLDQLATQLDDYEKDLRKGGAPPVDGGEDAFASAMANLEDAQGSVARATTTLEKAEVTDQASLTKVVEKLSKDMEQAAQYKGPAAELQKTPALEDAFEKAPNCSGVVEEAAAS